MKWFLNLKTSAKLISAFLLVSLILAGVGIYALQNLSVINDNSKEMYNNNLISVRDLSAVQINYEKLKVRLRDLAIAPAKAEKDAIAKEIPVLRQEMADKMNTYRNTTITKEEQELLKTYDTEWPAYQKLYDSAVQLAYSYQTNSSEFVKFEEGPLTETENKYKDSLVKLIQVNVKLAGEQNEHSFNTYKSARSTTITVVIISVLFSIMLGYAIAQSIARPLGKLVAVVAKVAEGDLREKSDIDTKDEVGVLSESINRMVDQLRVVVGDIAESAQSVAAATEQISASTEEIASGSTSQAQSASMIAELFKELSVAINTVAISAEEAAELANDTMKTAGRGDKVVKASIEAMQGVNLTMSRLEEDSNKIGDIIEVIDDIAEQTNLLALNAAIEAARAGEQGRGFAVVADEVRKLAERSSEATKEITSIIKVMQENTKQSVAAVVESMKQSTQTGEAFNGIIQMVSNSTGKVGEIAAACEQETAQASEVMQSVESIAAASEEAAAASEETANTCQSLSQMADKLQASVLRFKI